ncbi:UDP-N-acetylglucosamine transferase subunit ALG14-like protein [Aphelenchoides besseyi]|nr:UDP-N-acetylglucosamine transferase subunit ALG14-like protein [Aphelenchoides besseyi]KAI6232367.1 UDP-N-acetylglucosamine transferase subunit ALG14-like protein [Aphelenchoides besseyi]
MEILTWISLLSAIIAGLLVFRYVRHSKLLKLSKRTPEQRRALIVLGSGGHTSEMFKLMDAIASKCPIRSYILADEMSRKRVLNYESHGNQTADIVDVTRARMVGQSYVSSVETTLKAIFESISLVWSRSPDVVICNGPGTCIPICIVAFILDFFYLINCRIVYVESVCRVQTLSLSGKLLYYSRICDDLLVQWPELKQRYDRTVFLGRFM